MSVTMRIIQRFDPARERQWWALERQFAELEQRRPDYPKGRRLQPIASAEPNNTLIWECEFADLDSARAALDFFQGDAEHEALLVQALPLFVQTRVEFLQNLEL